jgi:glycosyltransferase involved in cell wall biosynthesis
MRILHLLPNLSGGGAERQFSYLAPMLSSMGHEVHVAYLYDGPQRPDLRNVFLNQLKSKGNHDPYLLWQLIRLIRRIKPDIVQTWITQMDILGGIAARITGVPWILREPSTAMAYPPTWKNRLRILIGSSANSIVSNSLCGKNYWENQRPHCKSQIIQNGVPLYEIDQEVANLPSRVPEQDCQIVLCAGRLESGISGRKNMANLLEALVYIKQRLNILGVICGEGSKQNELKKLAHKLGVVGSLLFTGHLSAKSLWALMKKAAVFVSLSAYEGCPNTVLEAMASGCPIVVSDIPAHRGILDESSALFVDPWDTPQAANAILYALLNKEESKGRALAARNRVKKYTVKKMATEYEKVYKSILAQRLQQY